MQGISNDGNVLDEHQVMQGLRFKDPFCSSVGMTFYFSLLFVLRGCVEVHEMRLFRIVPGKRTLAEYSCEPRQQCSQYKIQFVLQLVQI